MSELIQPGDTVDDKDNIINTIVAERDELKTYLEDFSAEIAEKDNTIEVLVAERDQLKAYLEESSVEIAEKDNTIEVLVAERDQLKTYLEESSVEIAEKDNVIQAVTTERDQYKIYLDELKQYQTWVPPGHFYSPLPCIDELKQREDTIWGNMPKSFLGIDLNEEEQIFMLESMSECYNTLPFSEKQKDGYRYYFDNSFFGYADGIILYCFLQKYRPKRIIEVGSGFSSALMLDVNEHSFMSVCGGGGGVDFTFIEPYPERLKSLLTPHDNVRIIEEKLQDVDTDIFSSLQAGDILFIDSTHVSKIDSDVNLYLFNILPRLAKGVLIHIHDIPYPFEYYKEWIYNGRAWNEAYMIRTFLQFNTSFKIKFWGSYFENVHKELYFKHMPLCAKCPGGSLWLEKTV